MGNGIFHIIRRHLCKQAAEFSEPELNLNIKEWAQFALGADTGVRNKCQKSIDCCVLVCNAFYLRIVCHKCLCDRICLIVFSTHELNGCLEETMVHKYLTEL